MTLHLLFVFFCIISCIMGSDDNIVVTNCKEITEPVIEHKDLQLRPIPIKLGKPVSVSLSADSKVPIAPGTRVEISASYYLFSYACPKFKPFCIDICEELQKNSSTCAKPDGGKCGNCVLPPGQYNVFYEVLTPNVPLKGRGSVKVKILDKSGTLLACVTGKADFE